MENNIENNSRSDSGNDSGNDHVRRILYSMDTIPRMHNIESFVETSPDSRYELQRIIKIAIHNTIDLYITQDSIPHFPNRPFLSILKTIIRLKSGNITVIK